MTEPEMQAAQARLDAIEHGGHQTPQWYTAEVIPSEVFARNASCEDRTPGGIGIDDYDIAAFNSSSKRFIENAAFVAHAPEDLRKALAALRRALAGTEEVDRLEKLLLAGDGWRCDACNRVFGPDDTNNGHDCDLCDSCAKEARAELGRDRHLKGLPTP